MDKMGKEKYLSKEETEELCRLYMECRLSRLEEAELNYVLGFLSYSTPLIEETRALMNISLSSGIGNKDLSIEGKKVDRKRLMKRILTAAASVLLLISAGIPVFMHFKQQSEIYCQVFAYGEEVSKDKALVIAKEEMERIDRFFETMSDIESEQQQKTESFQ